MAEASAVSAASAAEEEEDEKEAEEEEEAAVVAASAAGAEHPHPAAAEEEEEIPRVVCDVLIVGTNLGTIVAATTLLRSGVEDWFFATQPAATAAAG